MASCSSANAAAIVTGRPVITRPSSTMPAAAISWFSAASDATAGTGVQKNEAGPVMGAQRDEPLRFGPVPAAQHPRHGGLEVVIPDPAGHRAEVLERQHVPFQEGFLRLGGERDMEGPARARQ